MTTIKCNYKPLLKWIKHNPKVRTLSTFANDVGFKNVQNLTYYIYKEKFMSKELIAKIKDVYQFNDKEIDLFFYSVK